MRILSDLDHNTQREAVLVADASDCGIRPGGWTATLEVGKNTITVFTIVGFVRNAEGEILAAIYADPKDNLLRIFND